MTTQYTIQQWFRQCRLIVCMLCLAFGLPEALKAQELGTWQMIDSGLIGNYSFRSITAMDCADDNNCVMVGRENGDLTVIPAQQFAIVRQTTDGGNTWINHVVDSNYLKQRNPPDFHQISTYRAVAYPSVSRWIALSDSADIVRTTDGGGTWTKTRMPWGVAGTYTLRMYDTLRGWCYFRMPRYTTDGGVTWTESPLEAQLPDSIKALSTVSVFQADDSTAIGYVVASGRRFLARSNDTGRSWTEFYKLPIYPYGMCFVGRNRGWIVGSISTGVKEYALDAIYATTNGGMTWAEQMYKWNDPAWGLRAVDFADSVNGIAVGDQGKVLRTTNGGTTWKQQNSGLDTHQLLDMRSVSFPSPRRAFTHSGLSSYVTRFTAIPAGIGAEDSRQAQVITLLPNIVCRGETVRVSARWRGGERVRLRLCTIHGGTVTEGREQTVGSGGQSVAIATAGLVPGWYGLQVWVQGRYVKTVSLIVQ